MTGIYKFTNRITGEAYIGQSVDIQKRYMQHKNRSDLLNIEDTYFHSMIRHYGFNNFVFEVLEECPADKLNEREVFYIRYFNTLYPNGYNKTPGGSLPHVNKLNNLEDVDRIRYILAHSKISNEEIGKMFNVSDQTISDINSGRIWYNNNIIYPIRNGRANNKKTSYCKVCNKEITNGTKTGLCRECINVEKSKSLPSKDILYSLLLHNTFESVGKMFNVSGNAVKKWCDKYNLPRHSTYYRSFAS